MYMCVYVHVYVYNDTYMFLCIWADGQTGEWGMVTKTVKPNVHSRKCAPGKVCKRT